MIQQFNQLRYTFYVLMYSQYGVNQNNSVYLLSDQNYYNFRAMLQSKTDNQKSKYDMISKNYIFPQDKFSGQSTYTDHYPQKRAGNSRNQKVIYPSNYVVPPGAFNGNSSYAADYVSNGVPVRAEKVQYPSNKIMPEGRFDQSSTYANHYVQSSVEKSQMIKPEGQLKVGGNSFNGNSSYNYDYQNREQPSKSVKITHPANEIMPKGAFEEKSTYTNHYVNAQGQRNQPIKHQGQLRVGGAFDGRTNYTDQYLNRGQQPKTQKVTYPNNKIMPDGRFDQSSTYNNTYVGVQAERNQPIKHEGQLRVGGAFDGRTNYTDQYLNRGQQPKTEKITYPSNKIMPDGRFDESSTYNNTYVGVQAERNQPIKHQGQLRVGGEFDGHTNYTDQYMNRGQQPKTQKITHPSNKIMPDGRFDQSSTYNNHYVPTKGERSPLIKHEGQLKVGGKFDGHTNYTDQYLNRGQQPKTEKITYPSNKIMPDGRFDQSSTYTNHYVGLPSDRNEPIKHEGQLRVGGAFDGRTNYTDQYLNRGQQPKTQKVTYPNNKIMPDGRFDESSTYNNTYVGVQAQRNQPIKHQGQLRVGGAFDGRTNYTDEYLNRGKQPKTQKVTYPNNKIMPDGRFDESSTYNNTYIGVQAEKNQPIKHEGQLRVGGAFDGRTNYTDQYLNRGQQPKTQKVTYPNNKIMPDGRFDESSTYNNHYVGTTGERNQPIKHQGQLRVGGAFDGHTNYTDQYLNRGQLPKTQKVTHPDNKILPDGRFDESSTYNNHYIPTKGERSPMVKHEGQLKIGGKFDGNSSYAADYVGNDGFIKNERAPLPHNDVMPKGPFDGNSTYQNHYVENEIKKSSLIRPIAQLHNSDRPFEGNSTYVDHYSKNDNITPPVY